MPLDVGSILNMSLATYFLTERYYLVGFIYVLGTPTEHYMNLSLVLSPLKY